MNGGLVCAVSLGFGWGADIDAEMQSVATHRQNRGFPKGAYAPFGTRPCLQGVVCYTCWCG